MGLHTSSHHIVMGDSMGGVTGAPTTAVTNKSKHVPRPRAVQRPRAMAKAVTKSTGGLDHYKPRR
jgi:hypothetical protein